MSSPNSSTDPPGDWSLDAVLPDGVAPPAQRAPAGDTPHPVDQIAIRKLGGFNVITPDQWRALDRDHRLSLIKDGLVTFLYQGEDVPLKAALLGLKGSPPPDSAAEPGPAPTLSPGADPGHHPDAPDPRAGELTNGSTPHWPPPGAPARPGPGWTEQPPATGDPTTGDPATSGVGEPAPDDLAPPIQGDR